MNTYNINCFENNINIMESRQAIKEALLIPFNRQNKLTNQFTITVTEWMNKKLKLNNVHHLNSMYNVYNFYITFGILNVDRSLGLSSYKRRA